MLRKKSFRKVVRIEYFDNFFSDEEREKYQNKIFEALSEKRLVSDRPISLYLKEDIVSFDDLVKILNEIELPGDLREKIKKIFYVDDDLSLPNALEKLFLGSLESSKGIVFFIGAGVSKLLGVPLWEELADFAVKHLRNKGDINYSEEQKLRAEINPKQKLTIFHQMTGNDIGGLTSFYEEELKVDEEKIKDKEKNVYKKLIELEAILDIPIFKITTNIDKAWEYTWKEHEKRRNTKNRDEISKSEELNVVADDFSRKTELNAKSLYKIHGTIDAINNAVITTKQYIEKYRCPDELQGFLKKIFNEYTVVFIGSGIQEFEILEHCFDGVQLKHFALVGTFTGEEHLFRVKRRYFNDLNIEPIAYYRDFNDYQRILLVLDTWINEIKTRREYKYYDEQKILDEVLDVNPER